MGSCCRTLSVSKKASNRVWWTALLMRIRSYGTMCRSTTSNHSWQRPSEVVNKFTCRQWVYSGRQSATWNRSQRPASEWQRPSSGDKQSNDNNDSYKVNAKVNGGINAKKRHLCCLCCILCVTWHEEYRKCPGLARFSRPFFTGW